MNRFVHLHVHSHYSLLDGGNRIGDLVRTAREHGMSSIALTDHGNLFGAIEFYNAARKEGVKPILGMEAYISPTTRQDRSMGRIDTAAYHLLLLATNQEGWHNLIRLSSRAYLEGFYYRPRIDVELLSQFNGGLVCLTACLGGHVPSALLANQPKVAKNVASKYLEIFGKERFFIEIQNQGIPDQDRVNPMLAALAGEMGVGIVGTNDVHFLRRQDKPAHEVLTCISTGKVLGSGGELIYPPSLYLKDQDEMCQAMSAWPEAASNTIKIADMCNLKLDFSKEYLPHFPTPGGVAPDDFLAKLAWEGLDRRLGAGSADEYKTRLKWELKVIADKGYSSYLLIVNDFVQFARGRNIPIGPRGSGVATLLGYVLGIGDMDPVRYGLLFERWSDPQRSERPDFDIDICQEGRAAVIQYVRQKYGHVAQIITYGTLKAKAVVRDVGRVLDMPLPEVDAIAKKVPDGLNVTLNKALEQDADLRRMYDSDQRVKQVIDFGMSLEGLARHAGVHAAGVIVADEALENIVPLCKQSDSDEAITQWDGPTCEKVGLMKMDFLGLRTLTIIQRARELVRAATGADLDPEKLPLEDPAVYELFCKGNTDGVFQFESDGMKGILMQMRPSRIEDLIAANAMYRPGPMELIPSYCSRKKGDEPVPSVHPLVDDVLAETYGIMVYQEQVMLVLNKLGKLPLNRALTLIKAISKKDAKKIAADAPNFLAGAGENGIAAAEAQRLFDLILKFAGYGFNKAHSARYAVIAYQTAYFKVHYPREFLAATLTFESGDTEKVVKYMEDARHMGVKIAPPDINSCGRDFAVDGQVVRFGLSAVKGVGDKAVAAIASARGGKAFKHLYEFCSRVDLRAVNRATIEALIKCGAFDALGANRAAMVAAVDHAIEMGQSAAAERKSGQMNFFGGGMTLPQGDSAPRFPDVEPWSEAQLLKAEKETLGFYITSHPLVRYGRELTMLSTPPRVSLADIGRCAGRISIGCMIAAVRPMVTKNGRSAGKKMAMLTLEDLTGKCDAVVFSESYEQFANMIQPEAMVFIAGSVDTRRERPSIVVDEVLPMDSAIEMLTASLTLRLGRVGGALPDIGNGAAYSQSAMLLRLQEILLKHRGQSAILLELSPSTRADVKATIRPDKQWFVKPSRRLIDELIGLLGEENIILTPRPANTDAPKNRYTNRPWSKPNGNGNGGSNAKGPASAAVTRFN